MQQVDLELYRRRVRVSERPPVWLSVIDVEPEAARRTMVFVHGFGGWAAQWRYQLWAFSDVNRTVALDLRGHGRSDRPASAYTMDEFLADLEAVLDQLDVDPPFVLAGHSFGGAIVAEYTARHPDQVEKLILIASAGEYPLSPAYRWAFSLPGPFLRLLERYTRPWLGAPPDLLKRFYHNTLKRWNGWSLFRDIRTPTLVIMGHRDRVFPRAVYEEVPRALPNAQAVNVGVSAHLVLLERPDAVNRAVERFLGEGTRSWRDDERRRQWVRQRPWLRFYDEGVPFTVGLTRRPLDRFLSSSARRFPRRPALRYGGGTMRYRTLDRLASRFAQGLRALGVRPGERVMLLLPNLPQTVIAYFGTLRAGATVVFASPLSEPQELLAQLRDADAKVLVTLTRYQDLARQALAETGVEQVVLTNVKRYLPPHRRWLFTWTREAQEGHRLRGAQPEGVILWQNWLMDHSPVPPEEAVDLEDVAVIIYTGGTTDLPKGVMLSHRNLVANALQVRHWIPDLREGREVFLSVLPFSHSYGMTTALNVPISLGATLVLLPTFRTEEVLKAIRKYRPTIFPGVPTMYVAINNFPGVRKYGIQSIRACISGAAPLPVEVQEAFEKLTRGRLVEGYGLTEASPVTHANPLHGLRKVGSIGIPLPGTEAKVVDLATREDLPPGQIGELVVRGPQVMAGYWQDPEATAQVVRDGWLFTGDVARMDDDGYFQIISRKKDMILAGEYQVYPRDVEEVLYEHPEVKEVAVVGVPATPAGQRVKAYVVPREGSRVTAEELLGLCRARLAEWQVPWEIEFRDELPKSFVGKVLRRVLVEEAKG